MIHLENTIKIKQKINVVYNLSEDIEKFPGFMPHLKKSIILKEQDNKRHLEMSGVINGIKSSWTSVSTKKKNRSIRYNQVKGICKVMRGEWIFQKIPEGTKITIMHDFDLGWPIIGNLLGYIVVKSWIDKYCRLTLGKIKEKAESYNKRQ